MCAILYIHITTLNSNPILVYMHAYMHTYMYVIYMYTQSYSTLIQYSPICTHTYRKKMMNNFGFGRRAGNEFTCFCNSGLRAKENNNFWV